MPRDNLNQRFCNIVLRSVQDDLTRRELADFRANAGCLRSSSIGSNSYYVIEWPNMHGELSPALDKPVRTGVQRKAKMYYWEGEADNASDAKAKALNKWLEHHAPLVRARMLESGKLYPTEER